MKKKNFFRDLNSNPYAKIKKKTEKTKWLRKPKRREEEWKEERGMKGGKEVNFEKSL